MCASRSKRFFTLALSALFVLAAIPAGASGGSGASGASGREFDLQLDKALSGLGDEVSSLDLANEAVTEPAGAQEPVRLATLSTTAVNELWRSDQAVAAQQTSSSSSGKKRSWLKKKWWIPVLGAVVLGAALSDGDGDDTLDDGED